uniref:D-like protein n=1 Tax=Phage DP-2017a TaxID=1955560 RepID=A0A1Q1PVP0_9VIRU|nr:D-like protein [Phage DP-2017a]
MDNSNLGLIIQENGLEYLGRYYSTYRAIVINNNDELNMNRVHVYIPSVQNGIKIWALPKSTTIGGFFHGLKLTTPLVGEVVYIEFEGGDPLRPLWSYHGWATREIPDDLKDNNSIGLVTPEGNKIFIKDIDGELYIQTNSKVNISIVEGPSLKMTQKGFTFNFGDDFSLKKTLTQILDAILQLTVTTGVGPSGTPINAQTFTDIKNSLDNYLEE